MRGGQKQVEGVATREKPNALEAYYYKKSSMQQICLSMGYKNADTAKNLKYKCLQRLKKMMDNYLTPPYYVPQSTQK